MADSYYPPAAFRFGVTVLSPATAVAAAAAALGSGTANPDAMFQEVSGIQSEMETEEIREGGQNRYSYTVPKRTKYSPLVLKRGAVTGLSELALWFTATMNSGLVLPVIPLNIVVTLQNENGNPVIAWAFANAWPKKWEVGPLNAMDNKVLIETLELNYDYFLRTNLGGLG